MRIAEAILTAKVIAIGNNSLEQVRATLKMIALASRGFSSDFRPNFVAGLPVIDGCCCGRCFSGHVQNHQPAQCFVTSRSSCVAENCVQPRIEKGRPEF